MDSGSEKLPKMTKIAIISVRDNHEVISFKMLQILQFSIFLVRNLGIDAEMYSVQVPVMITTIGASEKNWKPKSGQHLGKKLSIKVCAQASSQEFLEFLFEKTHQNPHMIFSACFRESSRLSDGTID